MVQSKADRERQKLITDKCQSLIEVLLKDDDNKYCVDCDAKGPRWASWNLGVFLCIRCAGIHRNLGVHISKVKSVNLDAWTPEHVAYVQRMGNSRARAIYEANLPDDFRRPQTDTALESFIRAKYEHKKYIAQDYVDPGPPLPAFNIDEEIKKMKEQKKSKVASGTTRMISVTELPSNPKPRPAPTNNNILDLNLDFTTPQTTTQAADVSNMAASGPEQIIPVSDLSSIPKPCPASSSNNILDFNLDFTTPQAADISNMSASGTTQMISITDSMSDPKPCPVPTSNNILDLNLDFTSPQTTPQAAEVSKKVLSKESILSLYSMSPTATPSAAAAAPAPTPAGPQAVKDPFGLNFVDWSK